MTQRGKLARRYAKTLVRWFILYPIWIAAIVTGHIAALLERAGLLAPVADDPEERPHDPDKWR
jgi:hypothetical protein